MRLPKGLRFQIRGLIDGSLSVMGVVIGARNPDPNIIIAAGVAGSFANAFSNLLAALGAEVAEKYADLAKLEEAMAIPLRNTQAELSMKQAIRRGAAWDALFTFIGGLIPVVPFFFMPILEATLLAFGMVLLLMAGVGLVLGKAMKTSILLSIIKMVGFTIATAAVSLAVQWVMARGAS